MNLFSEKEKKELLYKFDLFQNELRNFLGFNNNKYKDFENKFMKLKTKLEQNTKNPYVSGNNDFLPYSNLIKKISSITKNDDFKNYYKEKSSREIKDAIGFLVTALLFPFFIPLAIFNLYKLVQDKNIILDEKPFAFIEEKIKEITAQNEKVNEEKDKNFDKSKPPIEFNEKNEKQQKKLIINEFENKIHFIETKKEIKILNVIEAYRQAG